VSRGIISQLRDLVPVRALSREESLQLAEQQARVFLELSGVTEAPVPEWIITELPNITANMSSKLPTSGATQLIGGKWRIVLRATEPATRRRFSMAHEFKHILDDLFEKTYFSNEDNIAERHRWVEGVCDYFAGCLLVPRPMLKKVWTNGTQDIDDLAEHFDVSRAAIITRLSQTGLTPDLRSTKPKAVGRPAKRSWGRYQRSLQRTVVAA
jgi:predicted transcriptional regulator